MDTTGYTMEKGTSPTRKPHVKFISLFISICYIPVKILSILLTKITCVINCVERGAHDLVPALRPRNRYYKINQFYGLSAFRKFQNENIFLTIPTYQENERSENFLDAEEWETKALAPREKIKKYFVAKRNFVIMNIINPLNCPRSLKRMDTIEKNWIEAFKKVLNKNNHPAQNIPFFLTTFIFKNLSLGFSCVLLIAFCFYFAPSTVSAENISYQSAYVWRTDPMGDYFLPLIMPLDTYTAIPGVAAKGLIKSITAAWKSEGDVQLEVSADDGLHYTAVVNGVPLLSGFVEGTALKWKATLGENAKLTEVKIMVTDSSGTVGSFGEPQLSSFKFRKSFIIQGSSVPLFNHQIKIVVGESIGSKGADLLCDGHVATEDFSDIRFVSSDGETLLAYSLEKISGSKPNRSAEFFVKIPELPMQGILLYLYYGNGAAKSLSNPKETFDYYDDFKDKKAFAQNWTLPPVTGGSVAFSPGGLILDGSSVMSKEYQFKGGIIEYCATAQTGFETRLIIRSSSARSESDNAQVAYASAYNGAQHCIAVGKIVEANVGKPISPATPYDYRVTVDEENNITFERYASGFGDKEAQVTYKDAQGLDKGFLGLKTAGSGNGESVTIYHWIRVRKLADSIPVLEKNAIGKEESVALPIFMNTTIAPNGDLVLAEGAQEGSYTTKEDASAFDIRIIAPLWKGNGITVDISADNGKNFKTNVSGSQYYYSAKGDFVSGRSVRTCVTLKGAQGTTSAKLENLTIQYALGSIVVLSPNAGDSVNPGSKAVIKWTAWDYEKTYPMKIEYSINAGRTFLTIAQKAQNNGSYVWNVPMNTDILSTEAMIRISDSYDNKMQATSKMFSIVPAGGL